MGPDPSAVLDKFIRFSDCPRLESLQEKVYISCLRIYTTMWYNRSSKKYKRFKDEIVSQNRI